MRVTKGVRRLLAQSIGPMVWSAVLLSLWNTPAGAASGEKAAAIVVVADMRGLSGWQLWLADLYNKSHLGFALFTIVMIPIAGVILGIDRKSVV